MRTVIEVLQGQKQSGNGAFDKYKANSSLHVIEAVTVSDADQNRPNSTYIVSPEDVRNVISRRRRHTKDAPRNTYRVVHHQRMHKVARSWIKGRREEGVVTTNRSEHD